MSQPKYWIGLIQSNEGTFAIAGNDNSLNDFGTKEKAQEFFTKAYEKAAGLSQTFAAGALISAITSNPRVAGISDEDMKDGNLFNFNAGVEAHGWNNVRVLKCNGNPEYVKKTYDEASLLVWKTEQVVETE